MADPQRDSWDFRAGEPGTGVNGDPAASNTGQDAADWKDPEWGHDFRRRMLAALIHHPELFTTTRPLLDERLWGATDPAAPAKRIPFFTIAKCFLRAWTPPGPAPSPTMLGEILRLELMTLPPETRTQTEQEWDRLRAMGVEDAPLIAKRVGAWAQHQRLHHVAARLYDALRAGNAAGEAVDLAPCLEALAAVRTEADGAAPFKCLSAPDFLAADLGTVDPLVADLGLLSGGAALFTGAAGVGKGMLELAMFLAWAEGRSPFGPAGWLVPARPLRIILFELENPPAVTQERFRRMLGGRPAPENLIIFTREETVTLGGMKGEPDREALARLAAVLRAHDPADIIAFDPLICAHVAEENSATEMARWLVPLRETVRAGGAATWLTHHVGWQEGRGRGTTALRAWADFELTLERVRADTREALRLELPKANFCAPWDGPLALAFDARTFSYTPANEADLLCPPADLLAWLTEEHGGEWRGPMEKFYVAAAGRFKCGDRTLKETTSKAVKAGVLRKEGRGETGRIWVAEGGR